MTRPGGAPRDARLHARPPAALSLRLFEPPDATTVLGWVRSVDELILVSPETRPPLTARKIVAWGGQGRRQFMIEVTAPPRHADAPPTTALAPLGYAELNDMPQQPGIVWIGHLVLDPARRGRGLGTRAVRQLLEHAFNDCEAREVVLVVLPHNQPAIRAYRAAGLTHQGEEWKRQPHWQQPYRVVRMGIDRRSFQRHS